MQRPKKAKKKHHLREVTDPAVAEAVERNDWTDPIGGKDKEGRTYVDPRLSGKKERR